MSYLQTDKGLVRTEKLGEFEFVKLSKLGKGQSDENIRNMAEKLGLDPDKAVEEVRRQNESCVHYASSMYHVAVYENTAHAFGDIGELWHLSIKRHDREPMQDWRVLQSIKTAICGAEVEAIELYPAESRVVDTANQYHLFAFMSGVRVPCGFQEGLRSDDAGGGSKQRTGSARGGSNE